MKEDKKAWDDFEKNHAVGDIIECTVKEHYNFGVFLDLGYDPILGFIPVPSISEKATTDYKDYYPELHTKIRARIRGFVKDRNQVYMSTLAKDLIS